MAVFSNRLALESSPYLLQHAHNPVDWYPWGDEALLKAKAENKPILISIGYSACHWCHVMERESFEDQEIAELMNERFINIKIDREERPDLDHIYMDAVQAMTGSGGWPLNVFLTPEARPFYGGTYFPPRPAFNRPSWKDVLLSISESFKNKQNEMEAQAENLIEHLIQANSFGQNIDNKQSNDFENFFNPRNLEEIYANIMKTADEERGGFGRAPKFPQTFTIQFLLHYYHFTKNEGALDQACVSLDKMIQGGIYDHIGGGFARYSTDEQWLVPHFEKMLYDNALLIIVLSEAYQITKNELYKRTIEQTVEFIERELSSPSAGFYSAIDADSEGEEGKYYVWSKKEIQEVLGNDADLFCAFYDVSENGNWEGKNILHAPVGEEQFANQKNIGKGELLLDLELLNRKLLAKRSERIRPLLDNKMVLSWNALMNTALCKASAALGNQRFKQIAVRNMEFMLHNLKGDTTYLFFHYFSGERAKFPAFLDDYAFLIAALIQLQETTADTSYLLKAKELTEYVIQNFADNETSTFFFTHREQKDVIIRKKEIYDGAIPSGNSVMAFNLLYLSIIFDKPEWKERTINICFAIGQIIINYPSSFGIWATLMQAITYGIPEIVITGQDFGEELFKTRNDFLHTFIPYRVFQSATTENTEFPLLIRKPIHAKSQIFLCKNYSCGAPFTEIDEIAEKLADVQKNNA
ncbi:MAG TPA: thioredoxin domain-containing protein [Puia sp.]|nr:thioredoxin domain-containing protein [Puia sp.]